MEVAHAALDRCFRIGHRMADLEPGVPERIEQIAQSGFRYRSVGAGATQNEQVDVGMRCQFAASVAADRNYGHVGAGGRREVCQRAVYLGSALALNLCTALEVNLDRRLQIRERRRPCPRS